MNVGRIYSWDELGNAFGFKPAYLGSAGGMVPSARTGALLLITHADGGRSFNYEDYWDGPILVYTGRGQRGHQERSGLNREAAENARPLLVFEAAGPRRLKFLGRADCVGEYWATAPDRDGQVRNILRLRLAFSSSVVERQPALESRTPQPSTRAARAFDPSRVPVAPQPGRSSASGPEERMQLLEKANQAHHQLLVQLDALLTRHHWREIREIPSAIDLWAVGPHGRVIFEAKTLTRSNELSQTRQGLAQLQEYRFVFGEPDDHLCLVTDWPFSDVRIRLFDSLGVAAVWFDGEDMRLLGRTSGTLLADLLGPGAPTLR